MPLCHGIHSEDLRWAIVNMQKYLTINNIIIIPKLGSGQWNWFSLFITRKVVFSTHLRNPEADQHSWKVVIERWIHSHFYLWQSDFVLVPRSLYWKVQQCIHWWAPADIIGLLRQLCPVLQYGEHWRKHVLLSKKCVVHGSSVISCSMTTLLTQITKQAREHCIKKRAEYVHWIGTCYMSGQLVFIDESSFDHQTTSKGQGWVLNTPCLYIWSGSWPYRPECGWTLLQHLWVSIPTLFISPVQILTTLRGFFSGNYLMMRTHISRFAESHYAKYAELCLKAGVEPDHHAMPPEAQKEDTK